MPYTVADTPELAARIRADLDRAVEVVRRGDGRLRSLVLTGGFARGEGAVLGGRPQNDYDLVAVRAAGKPNRPYPAIREQLERELGLHIDLAPIHPMRLRLVPPTIFWYETALRGRVLWGDDLLGRIRVVSPSQIDPAEGLRLLVNRAAGLLLSAHQDGPARRLQAAKALLAALDASLLAKGMFPPSQGERWKVFRSLRGTSKAPSCIAPWADWIAWGYRYKVEPGAAEPRDPAEAWNAAARTLLDAVPGALRHAGMTSLEAYGRSDGVVDLLVYLSRRHRVPGARAALHPTGRVRVATLRLLAESLDGEVRPDRARALLAPVAQAGDEPLQTLDLLRQATLQ